MFIWLISDLHEESVKLLCELYQLYHSDRRVFLQIFKILYMFILLLLKSAINS